MTDESPLSPSFQPSPEMESIIGALNALILNRLVTRVNTGKVHDDDILVPLKFAFLFFHRDTRPVTYKLIGTGETIKPVSYTHLDVYKRQALPDGKLSRIHQPVCH